MKTTYQQISNFRNAARQFMAQKPSQTKLHYAISKMMKATESIHQDFFDKEQDIRIDLAEADPKTFLLVKDGDNYSYTKENAKKLQAALRTLGRTDIEITPYTAKELPKDLEPAWLEFFVPFVIEEAKEPE